MMKQEEYEGSENSSAAGKPGDLEQSLKSAESNTSQSGNSQNETSLSQEIGKQASKEVFRLRVIVIMVLIATAVAVSLTILFTMRKSEKDDFDTQFDGAADKVIDAFQNIVKKMGAVTALGVAFSASARDLNQTWPFVTISEFPERAGYTLLSSHALYVSIAPVVTRENFEKWDTYVSGPKNLWIDEGYEFQQAAGVDGYASVANVAKSQVTDRKVDLMHYFDETGNPLPEDDPTGPYLPIWQTWPILKTNEVNENIRRRNGGDYSHSTSQADLAYEVLSKDMAVIGGFLSAPAGGVDSNDPRTSLYAVLRSIAEKKEVEYEGDPMAQIMFPVFDTNDPETRTPVALMTIIVHWRQYFRHILPKSIKGITVVLANSCDGPYTFQLDGSEAVGIGMGDHHDSEFDEWEKGSAFTTNLIEDGTLSKLEMSTLGCVYTVKAYPTNQFKNEYITRSPVVITVAIIGVFLFAAFMFVFYDRLVERRQKLVLAKATQSTAIVSSLFPKHVRDQLINNIKGDDFGLATKTKLKGFMQGEMTEDEGSAPIAELFPHCTVFFGDIAGFTAWSSTREPAQVFILLQNVYQAFDLLAKKRRVFKVETIGDSYMAVTGLPEPQPTHASIMVRFAWDCLIKFHMITKELEVSLGPETGELNMRFGLHSGPVTAGILRGDRARFQLFGDTVNTASRMESTGRAGKIQVSQSTARYLRESGKDYWLKPREDLINAKGKGVLNSFWANPINTKGSSQVSGASSSDNMTRLSKKELEKIFKVDQTRHIDWMTELLLDNIRKMVFARKQQNIKESHQAVIYEMEEGKTCLDEVTLCIEMPTYDAKIAELCTGNHKKVPMEEGVVENLREYVSWVASMYRENPFHNFEHACHVTMSVNKLLKRVTSPDVNLEDLDKLEKADDVAFHLHEYTFGLNSDPTCMFAILFAALIHDVDHRGVSNVRLMEEEPEMANRYRNKSIAECNSMDLAWEALMQPQFSKLRCCLFNTRDEMMRLRQLLVNVVLATDIFDKDLNELRKKRWARAFMDDNSDTEAQSDLIATIVMEHIIQASDVSHTMQHWHVYQKWNRKLFTELHTAYKADRMGKNPAEFWYQGELGFFDNYIIPLAHKLKECGVFGVSSDEYLNYAVQNRAEWEEFGEGIVADLVASLEGTDVAEVQSEAELEEDMKQATA